ncbi:hypothetical protein ANN_26049, partial [Periplaneta americana]
MQAVVDHTMKFKDVFIGSPGSVHDSKIYRTSPLGHNLEEKPTLIFQMQAVVDHTMKFKDVFIGYPGSVHDSRVFTTSPLGQNLEEIKYFLITNLIRAACVLHNISINKEFPVGVDKQVLENALPALQEINIDNEEEDDRDDKRNTVGGK